MLSTSRSLRVRAPPMEHKTYSQSTSHVHETQAPCSEQQQNIAKASTPPREQIHSRINFTRIIQQPHQLSTDHAYRATAMAATTPATSPAPRAAATSTAHPTHAQSTKHFQSTSIVRQLHAQSIGQGTDHWPHEQRVRHKHCASAICQEHQTRPQGTSHIRRARATPTEQQPHPQSSNQDAQSNNSPHEKLNASTVCQPHPQRTKSSKISKACSL